MKLRNNFFHYTVYRKMIISYILLVAVTVTLICSTLFYLFSANAIKEINSISQSMLTQTSYSCNVIHEQATSVGNQLANDQYFLTAMLSQEKDYVMDYHTILRLTNIQAVYPFINYISIYNGATGKLISKKWGLSSQSDEDIINHMARSNGLMHLEFFPRKVRNPYKKSPEYLNILSFIFYSARSRTADRRSALIINVDEKYVKNTVQGMSNSTSDNIFVIDSTGTVLSHTNSDYFLKDFSQYPYIQRILASEKDKGYKIEDINGEKHLVTYVKSDRLNWVYVSVKPLNLMLSNIHHLRNVTLITGVALMILGIFLSLGLTRNIYNPLYTLIKKAGLLMRETQPMGKTFNEFDYLTKAFSSSLDRTNSLEYSLETTYPLLKETYLRFLLQGEVPDIPGAAEKVKAMDNQLMGPYYCTIVIRIDHYQKFKEVLSLKDQALHRFAICNVTLELVGVHVPCDTVTMEGSHVVLLVQLKEAVLHEAALLALAQAGDFIKSHFNLSLTFSIGDIVDTRTAISRSYASALEYCSYRLFFGHGCIIDYEKIKNQLDNADEYPHWIEKKLLEALQLNNRKAIEEEVDRFIETIRSMTYHHAYAYFSQLLISVSKHFYDTVDMVYKDDRRYYGLIHSLPELETIREISAAIKDFCFKICDVLEERRSRKNIQMIQEVQEYIDHNYSDPNLSLEMLADHIHLSPGYLGKLFRSISNMTLNDYINQRRLEKAKELMVSTDEPASVICEKVGVFNNTYFFTLFKKTYGMTPTQYRKQYS